ncbi:hypothetical protein BG011_006886 [Mortierella polycephala]|uniref:RING-type E3 ubiquitin transferase n=1 Tax=Mortierella polycephala TaxID=41804 RepID=A0A9P6QBW8_9FUNG|nr:hypothetical protein BG011_006886 [Mortierella polycephala]
MSTNANNNSNSGSRSNIARPERPPSRSGQGVTAGTTSMATRTMARSTTLQPPNTTTNGRTPRGLSRVQRMYDEQSIRSTRSSSRASSLVAVSPPANAPGHTVALQHSSAEYMDIDPESVGLATQQQTSEHHHGGLTLRQQQQQQQSPSSASSLLEQPPARVATPISRTRFSREIATSDFSALVTGSDNSSLYAGLSNPRGGTSISSSLLPIRPDSDDDDDMDHDMAVDHDTHHGSSATGTHERRSRRYPGPEMVADLIHHQLLQSLQESLNTTSSHSTPTGSSAPTSASAASADNTTNGSEIQHHQERSSLGRTERSSNNSSSTNISNNHNVLDTSATIAGSSDPLSSGLRRRRLRSSSMRGLLGFQPTSELTAEETLSAQESRNQDTTAAMDPNTESQSEGGTDSPDTAERTQFVLNQLPFFMRLLTDLSRGFRPTNGTDAEDTERRADSDDDIAPGTTDAEASSTAGADSLSSATPDTTSETNAEGNTRPRRHHTTIRFIQIAGGLAQELRSRGGAAANAGQENTDGEPRAGNEEFGDAIIMFLRGLGPDSPSDTDSNDTTTHDGSQDTETTTERPRHRSPWVVLTLSGGYISSLMAAGADGEGGSNYDDLWMLSNLIGPARPITTTQEAIDSAGFSVGQFEHAVQGIRNVATLGDGTKCLVCMSEYEEGEDMRALKCHHGFHQECIDKWLTTGANKCPVCRAAAVGPELPSVEPEVNVDATAADE